MATNVTVIAPPGKELTKYQELVLKGCNSTNKQYRRICAYHCDYADSLADQINMESLAKLHLNAVDEYESKGFQSYLQYCKTNNIYPAILESL